MSDLVVSPARRIAGIPVIKAGERDETFNILVYGDSGVGKTTLAGSADAVPELRKVLMIDIEGGSMSIKRKYPNVETVRIAYKEGWKPVAQTYEYLKAGNHDYRTVIIDSLGEMQKLNMSDIMIALIAEHDDRDPDVASMREWGKNLEQMRKYIRLFRDLDMNVIFTCLAKGEKNQKTGKVTKMPNLSGKLANEVAGFLDIVCYLYVKEVDGEPQRLLLTGSTEDTIAKDRSDRLPMVMQQPTLEQILKYVNTTVDVK